MIKLSIIIPIKITFSNRFLLERLKYLINFFSPYNNIELIIVDSSILIFRQIIKKISNKQNTVYIFAKNNKIYSAAKARNIGAKNARSIYLLFYDADLVVKENFIEKIFEDIQNIENNAIYKFNIYPCLYLSEKITTQIQQKGLKDDEFNLIKERYLQGYNDEVLYLAVNTSTILVSKEYFFKIGGYNINFKGHGYEDFELIHRLYKCLRKEKLPKEYLIDYKTPFPAEYKGFRQYFTFISLPNFFEDKYTLHLWHSRPLSKKYYRNRKKNYYKFVKIISKDVDLNNNHSNDNIYKFFILNLLKLNGYTNLNKYCGFFRLNDFSQKNKKFSLKRKIRKFFLNPKLFFKDMKIKC